MESLVSGLRWSARGSGLFLVAFILFFVFGDQIDPSELSPSTGSMMAALGVSMLGMLVLWRNELIGGAMVVAGMLIFYAINLAVSGVLPGGWVLPVCFLPGILALLSHFGDKQPNTPTVA